MKYIGSLDPDFEAVHRKKGDDDPTCEYGGRSSAGPCGWDVEKQAL
jgi:hypothetical protein